MVVARCYFHAREQLSISWCIWIGHDSCQHSSRLARTTPRYQANVVTSSTALFQLPSLHIRVHIVVFFFMNCKDNLYVNINSTNMRQTYTIATSGRIHYLFENVHGDALVPIRRRRSSILEQPLPHLPHHSFRQICHAKLAEFALHLPRIDPAVFL